MEISWNENQAFLRGTVVLDPAPSHENHDIWYDAFPLSIRRLSGAEDRVNVVVAQSLLEQYPVHAGQEVEIEGEVRSFNNKSGRGSRLVITLYARAIRPAEGEHVNQLTLSGALCKQPVFRRTPMGREICDLLLAVNRRYGRADYLPCIAWGALARRCSGLDVGDVVRLEGRFQSRSYTKVENGESSQRIAYEISVMQLEQLDQISAAY